MYTSKISFVRLTHSAIATHAQIIANVVDHYCEHLNCLNNMSYLSQCLSIGAHVCQYYQDVLLTLVGQVFC